MDGERLPPGGEMFGDPRRLPFEQILDAVGADAELDEVQDCHVRRQSLGRKQSHVARYAANRT